MPAAPAFGAGFSHVIKLRAAAFDIAGKVDAGLRGALNIATAIWLLAGNVGQSIQYKRN